MYESKKDAERLDITADDKPMLLLCLTWTLLIFSEPFNVLDDDAVVQELIMRERQTDR